jgi:hypothetical protein
MEIIVHVFSWWLNETSLDVSAIAVEGGTTWRSLAYQAFYHVANASRGLLLALRTAWACV